MAAMRVWICYFDDRRGGDECCLPGLEMGTRGSLIKGFTEDIIKNTLWYAMDWKLYVKSEGYLLKKRRINIWCFNIDNQAPTLCELFN